MSIVPISVQAEVKELLYNMLHCSSLLLLLCFHGHMTYLRQFVMFHVQFVSQMTVK